MLKTIAISKEELIQQISLSCQMPLTIRGIVNRKIIAAVAEETGRYSGG
jgi:hypothetical protein